MKRLSYLLSDVDLLSTALGHLGFEVTVGAPRVNTSGCGVGDTSGGHHADLFVYCLRLHVRRTWVLGWAHGDVFFQRILLM